MKKHNPTAMIVALVLGLLTTAGIALAQQGGGPGCAMGNRMGDGMGCGMDGEMGGGRGMGQGGQCQNGTGTCTRAQQRMSDGSCTNTACQAQMQQMGQGFGQCKRGEGRR